VGWMSWSTRVQVPRKALFGSYPRPALSVYPRLIATAAPSTTFPAKRLFPTCNPVRSS
jgi:hypothetical protein